MSPLGQGNGNSGAFVDFTGYGECALVHLDEAQTVCKPHPPLSSRRPCREERLTGLGKRLAVHAAARIDYPECGRPLALWARAVDSHRPAAPFVSFQTVGQDIGNGSNNLTTVNTDIAQFIDAGDFNLHRGQIVRFGRVGNGLIYQDTKRNRRRRTCEGPD